MEISEVDGKPLGSSASVFTAWSKLPSEGRQHKATPGHNTGKHLNSFSHFTELPKELRLKIWQLHIEPNKPRIVEVSVKHVSDSAEYCRKRKGLSFTSDSVPVEMRPLYDIRPLNSIPAILHTCKESRSEALRYYRRIFDTMTWHSPRIYVKCLPNSVSIVDTICLQFPFIKALNWRSSAQRRRWRDLSEVVITTLQNYNINYLGIFIGAMDNDMQCLSACTMSIALGLNKIDNIYLIVAEEQQDNHHRASGVELIDVEDAYNITARLEKMVHKTWSVYGSPGHTISAKRQYALKRLVRGGDGIADGRDEKSSVFIKEDDGVTYGGSEIRFSRVRMAWKLLKRSNLR